jgi:hypothetical protein
MTYNSFEIITSYIYYCYDDSSLLVKNVYKVQILKYSIFNLTKTTLQALNLSNFFLDEKTCNYKENLRRNHAKHS